jgi:hypothetical protein
MKDFGNEEMKTLHTMALHWDVPIGDRLPGRCVWRKFFASKALDVMMKGTKEKQHRLWAERLKA